MKFQLKNIVAIIAVTLVLVSCSKDDESVNDVTGIGSVKLEFDQVYKDANFAANTAYINSNGEVVKVTKAKYIVSNIELVRFDGSVYTVPKSESYFIIDDLAPETTLLQLPNIPAGNYTKVKFGIGVDEAQFSLGATGQGDFLTTAQDAGMMWSWSAGYKFVAFEGTFTSATVTTDAQFKVHTGKTGTDYNYTTVTLDFPDNALVRANIIPQIHIMADLSQLIDGTNKINLSEQATIMGGTKLPLITANISNMFEVHHVHND
ncbi:MULTISPECIES: MbnP family protein [Flavobacterium]|uniref:MbnP family protein n=1 Tax=Flavobacterium jumunjinense TaxID=998845 RepID=A0ABV5GTW0_9FLAO|nr:MULTISPECIES: MbnP family protein [Flavobacterium]